MLRLHCSGLSVGLLIGNVRTIGNVLCEPHGQVLELAMADGAHYYDVHLCGTTKRDRVCLSAHAVPLSMRERLASCCETRGMHSTLFHVEQR